MIRAVTQMICHCGDNAHVVTSKATQRTIHAAAHVRFVICDATQTVFRDDDYAPVVMRSRMQITDRADHARAVNYVATQTMTGLAAVHVVTCAVPQIIVRFYPADHVAMYAVLQMIARADDRAHVVAHAESIKTVHTNDYVHVETHVGSQMNAGYDLVAKLAETLAEQDVTKAHVAYLAFSALAVPTHQSE